ncbi:5' DNA nuclease [Rhizobium beringeri]|jgi:NADH-quinone oxidoreductase subunit E|uniref:5' DNA nuclease n=1 Tax=Rhizobium beringeri TaxID=3019934 RepID=A0ABY1XSW7_9HYPH|nr:MULTISPECIES: 5' DNA nuclease [Rhizobium]NKL60915.1 5' DNA nuclease [Rhizobium leguminosarum bv. viciae]RWX06067.1 5' DNA nuclease [Rhizobium leguminosarum]TBC72619.1 5' DNA nuclease [Rhizobium leguminosarum]TBC93778.1 5' DNA nuclease [Rhizobium leguminosarum]TBD04164.1 5' DNA nuclease [Rhizobium leguminosarum]
MADNASKAGKKEEVADFAAGFGRLAAEMLENARAMPVHPLMAHPAAAFAAATAIGFGFSTQMAGAFFGAFQSALETTGKVAAALDDTPPDELKPDVDIRPENIRPDVRAFTKPPAEKKARPTLTVVKPVSEPIPASQTKPANQSKASQPKPAVKAKPVARRKADDLKLIAGIGPKLEQVLNAKGIRNFAEIAAWTDEEIARLDAELGFNGRIGRDDWTGQAKILAGRGRRKK